MSSNLQMSSPKTIVKIAGQDFIAPADVMQTHGTTTKTSIRFTNLAAKWRKKELNVPFRYWPTDKEDKDEK